MTVRHDCSARVWRNIGWYPCSRPATVERDGIWYCWQHNPKYIAEKAAERRAAWKAEGDREAAKYRRIARNARLGALVTPELAAMLERLASNISVSAVIESKDVARLWRRDTDAARALAARIRDALEANDES